MGLKESAGLEVFILRRTLSFAEWGVLFFLLIFPGVISAPQFSEGDWKSGVLIFAAVAALPFGASMLQLLPEFRGGRVLVGVYSRGIIWARLWQRGFIPWANLKGVRQGSVLVALVEHRGADKPIAIPLRGTGAPAAFITERLQH